MGAVMIKVEFENNYLTAVFEGEDFRKCYDELIDTKKSRIINASLKSIIMDKYYQMYNCEHPKAEELIYLNSSHYNDKALIMLKY